MPRESESGRARAAAAEVRRHREALVADVASGTMTLDVLLDEHGTGGLCDTVKVVVVAEKVPGVGKVRSRRAMAQLDIIEDARWGEVDAATLRALWNAMTEAATRPL